MTQAMVNFRMDSELIPFEINVDPFYSEANMERLERSIQKMERGEVISKSLEELRSIADE